MSTKYDKTTLTVARQGMASEDQVRRLADAGVLPHIRDSNGRRLFSEEAIRILCSTPRRRSGSRQP